MNGNAHKANKQAQEAQACQRCGALIYPDNKRCPQCGKFPILLHLCPKCATISPSDAARCWKCGRVFEPDGDYL